MQIKNTSVHVSSSFSLAEMSEVSGRRRSWRNSRQTNIVCDCFCK